MRGQLRPDSAVAYIYSLLHSGRLLVARKNATTVALGISLGILHSRTSLATRLSRLDFAGASSSIPVESWTGGPVHICRVLSSRYRHLSCGSHGAFVFVGALLARGNRFFFLSGSYL
jgi:hypothetical protein